MAVLSDLVQATWNLVHGPGGFERPVEDQASGVVGSGALDLSTLVATPALWVEGDIMEFPAGEIVTVVADNAATVNRGRDGTTAEGLVAGDVIVKNPLFPRHKVESSVNEVLDLDLWPSVWTWHNDQLTFVTADHMYDLDAFVDDVVLVYQENLAADERWHPLPGGWWDVERRIDTAVAANGSLFRLKRVWDEDEPVYYLGKRRPDAADLANLSSELERIVPYAAAAKLVLGRNAQQKAHRTSERGSSDFQVDYQGLMGEFLRLRKQHADRLRGEVRQEPRFVQKRRRRW